MGSNAVLGALCPLNIVRFTLETVSKLVLGLGEDLIYPVLFVGSYPWLYCPLDVIQVLVVVVTTSFYCSWKSWKWKDG